MHAILWSDNSVTRDIVGSVFDSEDRVTVCESGMELLAAVKAIASDLVVIDVETHGLGGLLLISAVQELSPGSPIVAVSQNGTCDSRLLLQKGVPLFRLAVGEGDGNTAFRLHVQSRHAQPAGASARSASAA